MGRNYYCEYCEKRMKNDVKVRKNHNNGLPHKMKRSEHMAKFGDPQIILEQESKKVPCARFLSGRECKFGSFCYFSHYTPQQIEELRNIVNKSTIRSVNKIFSKKMPTESITGVEIISNKSFWNYPEDLRSMNLPPSLVPIELDNIAHCKVAEWGGNS